MLAQGREERDQPAGIYHRKWRGLSGGASASTETLGPYSSIMRVFVMEKWNYHYGLAGGKYSKFESIKSIHLRGLRLFFTRTPDESSQSNSENPDPGNRCVSVHCNLRVIYSGLHQQIRW